MFWRDGILLRQINSAGQAAYDNLMKSGLYEELTQDGQLIAHSEEPGGLPGAYKVLRPELVEVISYPYEWSFSQLKAAALTTLAIHQTALKHNMSLRDASAYNIQFVNGRPCLIDTLSFEDYQTGQPWVAYRQFCQHFLAPLALMSYVDPDLLQLMRVHIDGLPLELAAKLLPRRAKLRPGLSMHISIHARFQSKHADDRGSRAKPTMSLTSQRALIDSLQRAIAGLRLPKRLRTEWGNYYNDTNYSPPALADKEQTVTDFLKKVKPERVLDLGANDGRFSRLATAVDAMTISADIDPLAVEANYQAAVTQAQTKLLPLVIDLSNPSPALGWANQERQAFGERFQSDCVMALALIHHLAIGNNLPLALVADYFASLAPNLIIEFVPKSDSQVQRLLSSREDIFADYSRAGFEEAFGQRYELTSQHNIKDSERTIYLMKVKS